MHKYKRMGHKHYLTLNVFIFMKGMLEPIEVFEILGFIF